MEGKRYLAISMLTKIARFCFWGFIRNSASPSRALVVPNRGFTKSKNSILDYLASTKGLRNAKITGLIIVRLVSQTDYALMKPTLLGS